MGDRRRRGEGQAGHHRQDRRKRDSGDQCQQDGPAERAFAAADRLSQQR